MEYKLGNSLRVKSKGKTNPICCPKCNTEVSFGVFSNFERRLAAKPTLLDLNTVYFLVCPNCAGVFTVDESIGESFIKGNEEAINAEALTQLKEFK